MNSPHPPSEFQSGVKLMAAGVKDRHSEGNGDGLSNPAQQGG